MAVTRTVVYTKDIQRVTGRSERYARKIMSAIRRSLGKDKHQLISLTEFCEYIGLRVEEVSR
ncbi:MAG TPA: hypothetical protein VD927_19820, partial [Chryseosolibacter sp.]|nr:hypothetical protein [Chryseosolibacter sp.]